MRRRVETGICEIDYVDEVRSMAASRSLPGEAALSWAAGAFKTLGHPGRLKIVKALDGRELCVCDLARILGVSMSATSQHLRDLRRLGAVAFRADGKLAYYRLADRSWLDHVEAMIRRNRSLGLTTTPASGRRRRSAVS